MTDNARCHPQANLHCTVRQVNRQLRCVVRLHYKRRALNIDRQTTIVAFTIIVIILDTNTLIIAEVNEVTACTR